MTTSELQSLTVGSEVGFSRNEYESGFGKVTKINGYGHIHVEQELGNDSSGNTRPPRQLVFDKYGRQYKSNIYHSYTICNAELLRERHAARTVQKELNAKVAAIINEFGQHKTGMGDFIIDAEAKAKLVELVNAL